MDSNVKKVVGCGCGCIILIMLFLFLFMGCAVALPMSCANSSPAPQKDDIEPDKPVTQKSVSTLHDKSFFIERLRKENKEINIPPDSIVNFKLKSEKTVSGVFKKKTDKCVYVQEDNKVTIGFNKKDLSKDALRMFYFDEYIDQEAESMRQAEKTKEEKRIVIEKNTKAFKEKYLLFDSFPEFNKVIKKNMHNPDSFKHVESKMYLSPEHSDQFIVEITFRGTNAFGGIVTSKAYLLCTIDGIKEIEYDQNF